MAAWRFTNTTSGGSRGRLWRRWATDQRDQTGSWVEDERVNREYIISRVSSASADDGDDDDDDVIEFVVESTGDLDTLAGSNDRSVV